MKSYQNENHRSCASTSLLIFVCDLSSHLNLCHYALSLSSRSTMYFYITVKCNNDSQGKRKWRFEAILGTLRKQPTFHEVATWALAKRRPSNECRNSTLMTITTQILVVFLIGWKKIPTNQKHYQDLGRDTSSVWNFCARYSDVGRETSAVFSGYPFYGQILFDRINGLMICHCSSSSI